MPSQHLRNRAQYGLGSRAAGNELMDLIGYEYPFSAHFYVDAENGNDTVHDGRSADKAFASMTKALATVTDNGVIHLRGPVFENCTAPSGVTGVTIVGDGAGLRHGSTSNVSEGYAPSWRTGSGVTDEPLLTLHAQGWTVRDILMAPGSASSGIHLETESGASPEKTLSGTRILGVRFAAGKYAVEDDGGAGYVTIAGCSFEAQTTCSVFNHSGESLPRGWRIVDNYFGEGSAAHIDEPLSYGLVKGNVFGTVASTGLYIDLTGGSNNIVTQNTLAGLYDTTDYVPGTSDVWYGNYAVTGEATVGDNGITVAVPTS